MSVPQDRNKETSNIPSPDPLPPDVKVIECGCKNADWRSSDNSKWTNVIKQPITVKKGSEIRIATNFIDQRGIDSDIIQFQSSGNQQDNQHTLLTQAYTVNDGYNGKTTTYDYISRPKGDTRVNIGTTIDVGLGIQLIDPGQDLTFNTPPFEPTWSGGSGNSFNCLDVYTAYSIRPNTTIITNPGKNYTSNDGFTITTSGGSPTNYRGRLICNELGEVVGLIFTVLDSDTSMGQNYNVVVDNQTNGSGLTLDITEESNGISYLINTTGRNLGSGYQIGDILSMTEDDNGVIPEANRPKIKITNISVGDGAVSFHSFMDQGYNYEKSLVSRWAQTFDISKDFVGGKQLNRNTNLINSIYEKDDLLSAGATIQNKEDEFVSGIFHTGSNDETFRLYAPVIWLTKGGVLTEGIEYPRTNFTIRAGLNNNWLLTCDSYIEDGLEKNVLNTMPVGSVYQIQCLPQQEASDAAKAQVALDAYENIGKSVNMTVRIKQLIQESGNVIAVLDNSVVDYVGAVTELPVFNKTQNQLPPGLNNRELQMELFHKNDGYPNGVNPTVIVSTDANGEITNYSIGNPGSGNRVGMIFRINDPLSTINSNDDFYCQQVDNTQGWNIPAARDFTLNNNDLVVNSGGVDYPLSLYLIPVFQYSDSALSAQNRGNRLSLSYNTGDTNISSITSRIHVKDDNNSGLFKPSGINGASDVKLQKISVNDFNLKVNADTNNITQRQLTYASSGDIIPFGDINDANSSWFINGNRSTIRFNRNSFNINTLPRNTIMSIEVNDSAKKVQIQLGDITAINVAYYDVDIICYDIYNNKTTNQILDNFTKTLLGNNPVILGNTEGNFINLNGDGNLNIVCTYTLDQRYSNTELLCEWNSQINVLPITSAANFFNGNTPVNPVSDVIKSNVNIDIRNTYNSGGFYFISSFVGDYQTILDDKDTQFNNGVPMWQMSELPPINNMWRASPYGVGISFIPNDLNQNQLFTTITDLWDYQPLYREKTITIDKPFVVPSDIAGIWTRSAHKLSSAVDFANGNILSDISHSGLLQNEFIMPVYGSNNEIGVDGMYVKNTTLYNQTGGLEPGHCIGISYVNEKNGWLCGPLMDKLPTDKNGNKYYNIYFRTPFTFIRAYDPFAVDSNGNPDRTSLTTLNQTGDKIGNANKFGESSKTSLFGDTMLAVQNDPTANPPTTNPELIGYEQGSAGGNGTGSTPVKFGTKQYFPLNYLNDPELYPRAKISQYIGSQNLALIFDTNVSTFTFQYFHTPYTSPFVDNQGGVNSIRIFYGNRKPDIYNHDTLGGLNVINYCRPTYNRGNYSYSETTFNNLNPLVNTDTIGKAFLNKLGFTDTDIGVSNNVIDNTKTGIVDVPFTRNITSILDSGASDTTINSINRSFLGTTGSDIDSSDAILTEIPAPEISAGLETYNRITTPAIGTSQKIIEKFGDMIYYPYSINQTSNSFNDVALTRFDNATPSYGAVGGLLLSNSSRGMGTPNTLGSTVNVDDDTVPVQLNPDCEIFLSYTVATESSAVSASLLPNRLSNAYMVVLSSIMKQDSMYLDSAGFVNGMSVISKTFLQGDFILSQGQFQFYASSDFILSEITTQIVDSSFNSPTSLGDNSTVIYSITNYNPVPEKPLPTIEEQQQEDELLNQLIQEHTKDTQQNKLSKLQRLNNDLYDLGLSVITEKPVGIVDAIRNQIQSFDLPSLSPRERLEFLRSPEGQSLVDNATDLRIMEQHLNDPKPIVSEIEMKRIHDRVRARTPAEFFKEVEDLEKEKIRERIQEIYTPQQIKEMEGFGEAQKFKEDIQRQIRNVPRVQKPKETPSSRPDPGGLDLRTEQERIMVEQIRREKQEIKQQESKKEI